MPAEVWIIFAVTLVNRAGMMALPFLILYLTKELHVNAAHAGLALSAYGIGGLVTAPFSGRLADRIGPIAVMRLSLTLTGFILFTIPLARSFAVVMALTFIWALVADATRPATMSALMESVAPEKRKAAIALNRLAINLGMSIGPAVGGFLAMVSFNLLFVIDGITSLAAAALLTGMIFVQKRRGALNPASPVSEEVKPAPAFAKRAVVWRDKVAVAFFASSLLVNIVFSQHNGAMPLYIVRDLHYPESFFGILFLVNTLLIVAIEVPLNVSMANWPAWKANALAALLIAIGTGALAFTTSALGIAMTVVIWTFGEMIYFPAATSYMADLAPPGRTGEYMGALSATFSLALVIGPWMGAALLDTQGQAFTWGVMFVLGCIGAGMLVFTGWRTRNARLAG